MDQKKNFLKILKEIKKKKIIHCIDYYCCKEIISIIPIEIMLVIFFLSHAAYFGHSCLPISVLEKKKIKIHPKIEILWNKILKNKNWLNKIKNIKFCSNGSKKTILVINQDFCYLYRYWKYEKKIIHFIKTKIQPEDKNIDKYQEILKKYLKKLDLFQKIALGIILLNKISFIMGGPGTGKTRILSYIILIFLNIKKNAYIKLTAPTGKAALKLKNSVFQTFKNLKTNINKKYLPQQGITLHKLLNIEIETNKPKKYKNTKKKIDLLIIDESSMIDLNMMYSIITNISKKTKIVFSGDINQLPPIGIGNIFKNMEVLAKNKYSILFSNKLNNILKCNIPKNYNSIKYNISDAIIVLKKNYRFQKKSGIKILEKIIKKNKIKEIKDFFKKKSYNITLKTINNSKEYILFLKNLIKGYKKYWKYSKKNKNPKKLINFFLNEKILCAVNFGDFGVKKINKILDKKFYKKSNIYYLNEWYPGRPIMITKNNPKLKLFNGDIGICLLDLQKELKIFFISENNNIKKIEPKLITKYELAWCTSIHKSQGSEFSTVKLIFPKNYNKILNKELLYTGITRAKKKLEIYSDKKIIYYMMKNKSQRYSGIKKNLLIINSKVKL